MPSQAYMNRLAAYETESAKLKRKLRTLSGIRVGVFILILFLAYYSFTSTGNGLWLSLFPALAAFFYLIRLYDRTQLDYLFKEALVKINRTELQALNRQPTGYGGGEMFQNTHHTYSYDLDLFGERSLFQYLNRCTHQFGEEALAKSLLAPDKSQIKERQTAIQELIAKVQYRQALQAYGLLHRSNEKRIGRLQSWLQSGPAFPNKSVYYLLQVFPLLTVLSVAAWFITENELFKTIAGSGFVFNLALSFGYMKKITGHLSYSSDILETLHQFSGQFETIEKEEFEAPLLKSIQQKLKQQESSAGQSIRQLATSFNYLDYIFNIFLSPVINGLFLFHIHMLYRIDKWKSEHRSSVLGWMQAAGEMEGLASLANFGHNHPETVFPELSEDKCYTAEGLGHPLLDPAKRVDNDLQLQEKQLIVLTGSNMSGKSTFLRAVGVNLVLAKSGAPVCARSLRFYPYDLLVSMRITDSLQDSESFFYAELKRLQQIIRHLDEKNDSFVLLDEILRGTNSNDKHHGTIGLLQQLTQRPASGLIATHDLTVADLTHTYPGQVEAFCFESSIIDNELLFDYKIKPGICSRLSASFLMQKMGIIAE